MTAEYQAFQVAVTADATAAIELYDPRHRQQANPQFIGRLGMEGFTVLEAATSPWQEIRTQLEARIISQPTAIDAIMDALEGSAVRLPNDPRPLANLAFLGPTGVGKSETAKCLAEFVGAGGNFIKIDCADYSHGHEISNLIGSPLGYVGHDQEPLLSPERIEEGHTVVLFDEIEKGSEQLYNLMLHIMEDGELRMRGGDTTSFRDAIIIMTSNLGAKEMATQLSGASLGFGGKTKQASADELDSVATKSFKEFFRPEFINRLTSMVVFHPLDRASLGEVLDSKLTLTNDAYEKELGARVSLSDAVRDYLIDIAAQELHMGARPLVRALDANIYTAFGRYLSAGAIQEGTQVKVFHRSEVGDAAPADNSDLVFAAKRDETIHKEARVTKALEPIPVVEVIEADAEAVEPQEDPDDDPDPAG